MSDLTHFSEAALKAELERRARGTTAPPAVRENIDWEPLRKCIIEGVERMVKEQFESDDLRHYVYEAAITCVYGAEFWPWRGKQFY